MNSLKKKISIDCSHNHVFEQFLGWQHFFEGRGLRTVYAVATNLVPKVARYFVVKSQQTPRPWHVPLQTYRAKRRGGGGHFAPPPGPFWVISPGYFYVSKAGGGAQLCSLSNFLYFSSYQAPIRYTWRATRSTQGKL